MFWVISVYFNVRNILPKFGTSPRYNLYKHSQLPKSLVSLKSGRWAKPRKDHVIKFNPAHNLMTFLDSSPGKEQQDIVFSGVFPGDVAAGVSS